MSDRTITPLERAASNRASRWLVRFPRAVPALVVALVAVVTVARVIAIEAEEEHRERAVMLEVAQTVAATLDRRSNATEAYLRAGAALFAAASDVSFPMFRRYASELRLDTDTQGSEGIGWAEIISVQQIDGFERQITAERGTEFRIRREPGARGDTLAPITFLKPDSDRSRQALGFDMYSQAHVREAMDRAEQTQRPIATGKLELNSGTPMASTGFLVFMPVFEGAEGARELKGFIFSPFDAEYFLGTAMSRLANPRMGVRLYDGPAQPQNLLAEHLPAVSTGKTTSQQVNIGNRPFVVEIESSRAGSLSPLSVATVLFGLALASLLLLVTRLLVQQAKEDQAALAFFEEQNSIRNSLTRELNHRVKNTLASIISIISLTRRRTDDLDEFADGLEGRVRALSATHDLLTRSEWGTTPLKSVVEAELAPYAGGDSDVLLDGPDIELAPNDALSLGLAIHELATNAAKYGALSRPGATVAIKWEREGKDLARLEWTERGGPPVSANPKPGFGTELIQKIVAHELRNPVEMKFDREGVSCTLHIPLRVSAEFRIRERLARLSE